MPTTNPRSTTGLLLTTALLLAGVAPPAAATHAASLLDLDAATSGGADVYDANGAGAAPVDWATLFGCVNAPPTSAAEICASPQAPAGGSPGHEPLLVAAFLRDYTGAGPGAGSGGGTSDPTAFTGGGSKDSNPISSWQCTTGVDQQNDKDALLNAYAALYRDSSDHGLLYVGAERQEGPGTTYAGFWFLQDRVGCDSSAGAAAFTGAHQAGDLLLIGDFSGGGSTVKFLRIYRWDGAAPVLVQEGVQCSSAPATDAGCGSINTASRTQPWGPRTGAATGPTSVGGALSANRLLEAGVNLNQALGIASGANALPCFRTLVAETRASDQINAVLKDFASQTFHTCVGTIAWEKRADVDGLPLLPGATFTLSPNPATGLATPLSVPDCTAAPCAGPDMDPTGGAFLIKDAVFATAGTTYTIEEAAAPANHILDSESRTVTLTRAARTASVGMPGVADEGPSGDFLNAPMPATLRVRKAVTNDNGGSADAPAFTLRVQEDGTDVTGSPFAGSATGTVLTLPPGTYVVSESGLPAGYALVGIGGDCDAGGIITLAAADDKECVVTNDDVAPTLTLVKRVTNDNGGTATADAWTLTATGPTTLAGQGPVVESNGTFQAGTYALAESGGPSGYAAGAWACTGTGTQDGSALTLAPGQTAECTLVNDDVAPRLTLVKRVTNDNGGTATPADWVLTATAGDRVLTGAGPTVESNATFQAGTYALSESGGPTGYAAGAWSCTGTGTQEGDRVTLGLGEAAECALVNDDVAPALTLVKVVENGVGGTATPADWTLTATGPTTLEGAGPTVASNGTFHAGTYALAESAGPEGYFASAWTCTGTGAQDGDRVTLALAASAECVITNSRMADVTIAKTTAGAPQAGWTFDVRVGASASAAGTLVRGPLQTDEAGLLAFGFFMPGTYQVCESKLMPAWHSSIEDMPGAFVPNSLNDPFVDNSVVCAPFAVAVGDVLVLAVENTPPPGGGARTIGFWRNWSQCTGGNQAPVLDETLVAMGGVAVGDLWLSGDGTATTCKKAWNVLSKSNLQGKKMANDAAYELAAQLLAAKLNVGRGAGACQAALDAIAEGQSLLDAVGFTGTGGYLGPKVKGLAADDRAEALLLAAALDAYNNNGLC